MKYNGQINVWKVVETGIGVLGGFLLFLATSHPRSVIHKKLPRKKLRNITVSPHITYHTEKKIVHVHHWMIFSALYMPFLLLQKKFMKKNSIHGFFIGVILQGLWYSDRFVIVSPKQ